MAQDTAVRQREDGPQPLTDRQRDILAAVCAAIDDQGYPPSFDEIRETVGLASANTVRFHLDALERKGWVRRKRGRSGARTIQVLVRPDDQPAL